MILFPYKPGSESSKNLAEALGIKRISHRNSKFKGNPNKLVLNWGASSVPDEVAKCTILNRPEAVAVASNKANFFQAMGPMAGEHLGTFVVEVVEPFDGDEPEPIYLGVSHAYYWKEAKVGDLCPMDDNYRVVEVKHPEPSVCRTPLYTTNKLQALTWLRRGQTVVCRTVLNGHSGEGIVLAENTDELVDAPLYVQYVPKKREYRVHVFRDECVDVQRKARRKDVADEDVNWKIRNHDNGFIFARGEALGDVPPDVIKQAVDCVRGCGLDFGAVDVIYNDKLEEAYVLEVNTAPGLSGATLDGYVARLKELV